MPIRQAHAATHDSGADGRWGPYLVEIKHDLRSMRQMHSAFMQLATYLDEEQQERALLVFVDPTISKRRLQFEGRRLTGLLRADLRERFSVVSVREGGIEGLPADAPDELRDWLGQLIGNRSRRKRGVPLRRPSARSQVLELLVQRWMVGAPPATTKWLEEASGFSYPSVASALRQLRTVLRRESDRRVGLTQFPRDEWARLVADADEGRSTFWFLDRSGQPRSQQALLSRLGRVDRVDIAIGGADGARHHVPDLDLIGSPWTSLSIHCPDGRADLEFVRKLDPALELSRAKPAEPPTLVVHCVQRPKSPFMNGAGGQRWADAVSCLLDLHEARLETAASTFVAHFEARRGSSHDGRTG